MTHAEILTWLRETDPARLADLWQRADQVRQDGVGGEVHLRGLIEISNYCVRLCAYCGLRAANRDVQRYRMSMEEIFQCVGEAIGFGYGSVVLQAGEDPGLDPDEIAGLVRRIKAETPLAVTLSLGERDDDELKQWRAAGADRYLLRFETSNRALYDRIHPPRGPRPSDRLDLLRRLRALGYETGSGVMIGIPGQTFDDLARDISLFAELDLDMIGVGPFVPHPSTPLGENGDAAHGDAQAAAASVAKAAPESGPLLQLSAAPPMARNLPEQVPADELTTYKVVALARLVCPRANIPATTALATVNRENGRELALVRGANVVMPNLTPTKYRAMYEIYPNKACLRESATICSGCLRQRIASIGRVVGQGRGDSRNYAQRAGAVPGGAS